VKVRATVHARDAYTRRGYPVLAGPAEGEDALREGSGGANRPPWTSVVAEYLAQSEDRLTVDLIGRFRSDIVDYGSGAEDWLGAEVSSSARQLIDLYVALLLDNRRLTTTELSAVRAIGARRAEQGISLNGVLTAVRTAMLAGWEDFVDWSRENEVSNDVVEAFGEIGLHLLTFVDDVSCALILGYTGQPEQGLSSRERRRRAFAEQLLAGTLTQAEVNERSTEFGWDAHRRRGLLVLCAPPPSEPGSKLRIAATTLLRRCGGGLELESRQRDGAELAVILPVQDDGPDRLLTCVREEVAEAGLVAIYSVFDKGVLSVAPVYRRLHLLLPVAARLSAPGDVLSSIDLSMTALLLSTNPQERKRFVEETIGPILSLPNGSSAALLTTLGAIHDAGGRASVAAVRLDVHPKTVQYRLNRITELTGFSSHDPEGRLRLDLALQLWRLADRRGPEE
jgi:sugar diacid utilization regulator